MNFTENISLLIKPVSGDCNLQCEYCFYKRVNKIYEYTDKHFMKEEILECLISQYLNLAYPVAVFVWQGGEPLMRGIDFFKNAISLMQKFGRKGHIISNAIQTNGLLINDEYAKLFLDFKFLVGISLDGTFQINNKYRGNTFDKILNGIDILRKFNVDFNILTVVSKANVNSAKEIYQFFKKNEFLYVQFIPCLTENKDTQYSSEYSISPEEYGRFLCELFDEWIKDKTKINIRLFDNVLETYLNIEQTCCQFKERCGSYVVIEFNGDVYPCDFFVYPEWKFGNIANTSLDEILKSTVYKEFCAYKSFLPKQCNECKWKFICNGGCLKTRYINGSIYDIDYFCEGYKIFFEHTRSNFEEISIRFKKNKILKH